MRTLIPLACVALLIALTPCWASEQKERFLEFSDDEETLTFDLSTVKIIQPGRFTVISSTIDKPEVMKLKLKALDTLRTYCSRPSGKYPFPSDILTLGPADMPIKRIEVLGSPARKTVLWYYPYKRLAMRTAGGIEELPDFLSCRDESNTEAQLYLEKRARITNGYRMKKLFDCKRGLSGMFLREDDDPSKVHTDFVKPNTVGEDHYARVCLAVMHEMPFLPERPSEKQPAAPSAAR